jgi:cathepsin L
VFSGKVDSHLPPDPPPPPTRSSTPASEEAAFSAFASRYGKVYNSAAERSLRKKIFTAQSRHIAAQNAKYAAGQSTHFLAANHFSDLSADEWRGLTQGRKPRSSPRAPAPELAPEMLSALAALPSSINWTAGVGGIVSTLP